MPDTKPEPTIVQKRAIDITPYNHGIWCSISDGEPFTNTIVHRRWSEDGAEIVFGLDSHNAFFAAPDELVDAVEVTPSCSAELLADVMRRDAARMKRKPVRVKCPHCKGTGSVWQAPKENLLDA